MRRRAMRVPGGGALGRGCRALRKSTSRAVVGGERPEGVTRGERVPIAVPGPGFVRYRESDRPTGICSADQESRVPAHEASPSPSRSSAPLVRQSSTHPRHDRPLRHDDARRPRVPTSVKIETPARVTSPGMWPPFVEGEARATSSRSTATSARSRSTYKSDAARTCSRD